MTPTELKLLKIIWHNTGRASVAKIAKDIKISTDYVRLVCEALLRNKIIDLSQGRYELTGLGKKALEKLGIIEKAKQGAGQPRPTSGPASPKTASRGGRVEAGQGKKRKKSVVRAKQGQRTKAKKLTITDLSDISRDIKEAFKGEGLEALEDIATSSIARLMEVIEGLKLKEAANLINKARDKLRKNGKEYLWEE